MRGRSRVISAVLLHHAAPVWRGGEVASSSACVDTGRVSSGWTQSGFHHAAPPECLVPGMAGKPATRQVPYKGMARQSGSGSSGGTGSFSPHDSPCGVSARSSSSVLRRQSVVTVAAVSQGRGKSIAFIEHRCYQILSVIVYYIISKQYHSEKHVLHIYIKDTQQ